MARAPVDTPGGGGQSSGVLIKDRYTVHPNEPLPAYDGFHVTAYEAADKCDAKRQLIALVCAHGLPFRSSAAGTLLGADVPGMARLVDPAVAHWPQVEGKVPIVLYERSGSRRAMNAFTDTVRPIPEQDLVARVIKSIASAIAEMQSHGVTHRAIRPNNIFFNEARGNIVVLGDCITTPPGMGQPADGPSSSDLGIEDADVAPHGDVDDEEELVLG